MTRAVRPELELRVIIDMSQPLSQADRLTLERLLDAIKNHRSGPHSVVQASDFVLVERHLASLPVGFGPPGTTLDGFGGAAPNGLTEMQALERVALVEALRLCHGNRTRAASKLGLSLRTVRNRLHEYAIDVPVGFNATKG